MKNYISKVKKYIVLQVLFDFIGVMCLAIAPLIQKWLFDKGLDSTVNQVIFAIILYGLLLAIYSLMQYFCILIAFKSGISFETNLKESFFHKVFNLNSKKFYEKSIGEYISIQANDITALEQDYLQPIVDIIRSVNMMIIYAIIIFANINYKIGLVIIISSIFAIFIPRIFGKMLDNSRTDYQKHLGKYTSVVTDLLEGFDLINSKTVENITNRHNYILHKTASKRYDFGKKKGLVLGVSDLTTKMVKVFTFAMVGYLFYKREISVGIAVATISYASAFIEPIDNLLYDITTIRSISSTKQNILSFLNQNFEKINKKVINNFKGEIVFENVNYKVDDFELKNINLKIEKGKKYAIIGKSGAGKSTFIKLLLGINFPQNGNINIDTESVEKLDITNTILYMVQKEHIYHATVRENITIFNSYSTEFIEDEIYNVTLAKNILNRKDADCMAFSGEEKRIIALLRMLCKKGDVLILDEPFTGIDTESVEKLESILLNTDKTILIVTHNTADEHLQKFDKIITVSDGNISVKDTITKE